MEYKWKFQEWDIVNYHLIVKRYGDNHILVTCPKCRSYVIKSRKSIENHLWCKNCRKKYLYYTYIYWIPAWVISLKLRRWWTMNQVLWLEPRKIKSEDFSMKDLKYLWKINSSLYEENLQLEKNALFKYKINKWKI